MIDSLFGRPGTRPATVLDTLARALVGLGVRANVLSSIGLVLGLLSAALFFVDRGWWALVALLASGLVDAVDGRVARLGPGPTPWGGVLDLTFDRIVEAAVLLGIAVPKPAWHLPALVVACTWYVNLCVFLAVGAASAKHSEKVIAYPPGLLERTESLIPAFIVVAAPGLGPTVLYLYAALEVITGAQRFRHGRRTLAPAARGAKLGS